MHAAGRAWIGKLVLRYWEDQGGWWEALVGDYSVKNGKHKLIYDAGTEDVSYIPDVVALACPGPCTSHLSACFLAPLRGLKCLDSSLDGERRKRKTGNACIQCRLQSFLVGGMLTSMCYDSLPVVQVLAQF